MRHEKPTIWVMALEPIETRYTGEWYNHVPNFLELKLGHEFHIEQISGVQKNTQPTPGAFLNFSDTNYWKSSQICNFLNAYNSGLVSKDDHFIFTDAWNPAILQLKYMSDLLGLNWTLHGLWHAGSYDNHDFLGRIIGGAEWVRSTERALFYALDHNYFASQFHIDLFSRVILGDRKLFTITGKIIRCGWPMEYLPETISKYTSRPKKKQIVFPHRVAPEKQVNIFKSLQKLLPEYEFVICQDRTLTKEEYHQTLADSMLVFSCSLQETLGIGVPEGVLANALPLVPDRLSYSEMYPEWCKYPAEWTADLDSYNRNQQKLCEKIRYFMENYEELSKHLNSLKQSLMTEYFSCKNLIDNIARKKND